MSMKIRNVLGLSAEAMAVFCAAAGCGSAQADSSSNEIQDLQDRSMLFQGDQQAKKVAGMGAQWQHHFEDPEPKDTVKAASVWMLHYPGSVITEPGKSVIATWADPQLWDILHDIGIEMLHTD